MDYEKRQTSHRHEQQISPKADKSTRLESEETGLTLVLPNKCLIKRSLYRTQQEPYIPGTHLPKQK